MDNKNEEFIYEDEIKSIIMEYFGKSMGIDSETYCLISQRMKNIRIKKMDRKSYEEKYRSIAGENCSYPWGYYCPGDYSINLFSDNIHNFKMLETIIHETIHALSDNKENKMGFKQYDENMGNMFNEMATCYITSKILGEGNGGNYSRDTRAVFNMFIGLTDMTDNELQRLFFQSENWCTDELKKRFDKNDLNALENLVRIYDRRSTKEFDKKRVLSILLHSAKSNGKENDESFIKNINDFCDYFEIDGIKKEK